MQRKVWVSSKPVSANTGPGRYKTALFLGSFARLARAARLRCPWGMFFSKKSTYDLTQNYWFISALNINVIVSCAACLVFFANKEQCNEAW